MSFVRNSQNCCLGVGANNVAYIPDTTNPLYNYFGNGGILPLFRWAINQPEQFWVNPVKRVEGLQGVIGGRMAMLPLTDTRGGPR